MRASSRRDGPRSPPATSPGSSALCARPPWTWQCCERTKRLAVVTGGFRWDDIGSWDALLRIRKTDARGNVVVGKVTVGDDVKRSVIWSESEHLAITGIEDMVVVRANGHTLVMPTGRPEQLKQLVQRL